MFFYNIRSLIVQWRRQLLSIAIVAAATATFIVPVSAFRSFAELMHLSSEDDNLVLLTRGGAEIWPSMSRVPTQVATDVGNMPGVKRSASGAPLVSPEFLYTAELKHEQRTLRVTVRGVEPEVFQVHRIVRGTFRPGEALIGSGVSSLLPGLAVGDRLEFAGKQWPVGGFFEARSGQTQYDCEIWVPLRELMASRREVAYGPVTVKAASPADARSLIANINADRSRFPDVRAVPDAALVEDIYKILSALGVVQTGLSALLLTIAGLAVLNVQLSNVLRRRSDMALLRAFGSSRMDLAAGFVFEGAPRRDAGRAVGSPCPELSDRDGRSQSRGLDGGSTRHWGGDLGAGATRRDTARHRCLARAGLVCVWFHGA
jgi:ABC-type lipoprotein release transport system permease subunit